MTLYDANGNIIELSTGSAEITPSPLTQYGITNVQWHTIKSSPQVCFVYDLDGITDITSEKVSFDLLINDTALKSFGCTLCQTNTYSETSIGSSVERVTGISITSGEKTHYEYTFKTNTSQRYAIIWFTLTATDSFTVPLTAKFFDIAFVVNGVEIPLYKYYIMSAYSDGSAMKTNEYVPSSLFVGQDDIKKVAVNNHWYGKKWIAFGTSITDIGAGTGKYIPYLAEYSGMACCECGNGGGFITDGGTIYKTITNKTTYEGYDLITIEGFVNDWYTAKPIGSIGDTTIDTFCGALYLIIKHLKETSTAAIVVITDHHTRATDTYPTWGAFAKNSNGNTQADYWEATKSVCNMLGVPVIEAGANSGISPLVDTHYVDQIHHSDMGGEVFAQYIWSKLKDIPPMIAE